MQNRSHYPYNNKSGFQEWGYRPSYECRIIRPWETTRQIFEFPDSLPISRNRYGLTVEVSHFYKESEWAGRFAPGEYGLNVISACPDPDILCVVSEGTAYFVNTIAPHDPAVIVAEEFIEKLYPCENLGLLLVDYVGAVVLCNGRQIFWKRESEFCDETEVLSTTGSGLLVKEHDVLGNYHLRRIDIRTGKELD